MAGANGQDVQVPAGHAFASATAGTGGLGSAEWPIGGRSSSVQYTMSFVFSGQAGLGGGGGGFGLAGGASASISGAAGAMFGPSTPGGVLFNLLPVPGGIASEDHFVAGGSGGGGGGMHSYLALTGQPLDTWRAGAGGAGGGGGLLVRSGGPIAVGANGVIVADGGDGAVYSNAVLVAAGYPPTERGYPQPGGGGSGGGVLLQAGGGLSQLGSVRSVGGAGGRIDGASPPQAAVRVAAGDGAPGSLHFEAFGAAPIPGTTSPTATVGVVRSRDAATGSRSLWYALPAGASSVLRYEVEAVVFGMPVLFSDDPSVSPIQASDPTQPVVVRFQGADLDPATGVPNSVTPWRAIVNPRLGGASVGGDGGNGFRFDVVLRTDLDPNVRVTRVTVFAR